MHAEAEEDAEKTAAEGTAEEIGLGFAELLALLALHGGPSAQATAELLGIIDYADIPEVLSSGASALVARRFAEVGSTGELLVEGPVAGIAAALGGAERRMDLTLESSEWSDRIILLEAPGIAILLRPRAYGTWWALPQRADLAPTEATFQLIAGHLGEHPDGRVLVERHGVGQGYALSVRRAHDGGWLLGVKMPDSADIAEDPGDDGVLLTALRAVRND
ncbi:hypothetical protein [Sinomonas terrae]|uniref:Uncharacterized protein n=1 Tax=Sinomonas terrae TaxID=2908838 RepID=A0ABS9TYL2_9MICC|nr:hypothetical protein [Sinomonas terrae]MCH6469257.1 hypothetical protein [Sinomonas terrae]